MTVDPFAAMDEAQARQARELPSREEQLGTIWRVAQAAVLYVRADRQNAAFDAYNALHDAVDAWASANPDSAARLEGE